jgi:hypothetical protein
MVQLLEYNYKMRMEQKHLKIKLLHSSHVKNESWNGRSLFDASNAFRRVTGGPTLLSTPHVSCGVTFMAGESGDDKQ